jgi:DNA uptake protein ComE-like DNA-binding protein
MPSVALSKNAVMTQPMSMPPRPAAPVAPPVAPGQKPRATQRLMVKSNAAGRMSSTGPLPNAPSGGAMLNLPAGMILRCLPPEMLSSPLADFEASGAAATEIPLPVSPILSQLPSGKVELPIGDVVAQFPPGFLKSGAELAPHLGGVVNLPLMDVVMRIPPDMLAVRPDQKDVDPSVRRMADPFAGERPPAPGARIVEENQVPATEEFVPTASQPAPVPPAFAMPAAASTAAMPAPPPVASRQPSSFIPPPRSIGAPLLHQTATLSGRPTPLRATAPMPGRILPAENPTAPPRPPSSTLTASQTLGVPRNPSPLIGTTASGPLEPRKLPPFSPVAPPAPPASSIATTMPMPRSALPTPPAPPETDAGELKRLAALAMAEMETRSLEPKAEEPPAGDAPTASGAQENPAAPDLRQFAFNAPEKPAGSAPLPPVVKNEPIAVTSRFPLPSQALREAAETTQLSPAAADAPPIARTARVTPPPAAVPAPTSPPGPQATPAPATAINLNNCSSEDLLPIPGMTRPLASAIVTHREKIGEFHNLDQLLDVPGMTRDIYSNLTGETPSSGVHPSINELLGFPLEQELSLKDVTDRICCWPDVTGCLLSQKNGLHLVGTAPDFLDKQAIVAFAPRMFEDVNKSFTEITGKQTDELTIPTTGTSFHLLREKELYMIILSRLPLMPERHLKIARFVLAGLSSRPS